MIRCELCHRNFEEVTWGHLKFSHGGMTLFEYEKLFPEAPLMSPELKAKHSTSQIGKVVSQETRDGISKSNQLYWSSLSPEDKVREVAKRTHEVSIETCLELSRVNKIHYLSLSPKEQEEWVRPMREHYRVGYTASEYTRELTSKSMKKAWSEGRIRPSNKQPNKSELALLELLDESFPGIWEYVGNRKVWIGGRNPDFICRTRKAVIELFGVHWHDPVNFPKRPTCEELMAHFESYGYKFFAIEVRDYLDVPLEWFKLRKELRLWWETQDSYAMLEGD